MRQREKFLLAHPYCQWYLQEKGIPEDEAHLHPEAPKSNQIHHRRGRTGMRLLEEEFWLAVSDFGHKHIHTYTKESYEKGYLLPR